MKRGPLILISFLIIGLAGALYFGKRSKEVADETVNVESSRASSSDVISEKKNQRLIADSAVTSPTPVGIKRGASVPYEVAEADFRNRHAKRIAAKLVIDLNSLMATSDFTQAEIDIASRFVGDAFLNPVDGVVKLSEAIAAAADTLRLDKGRTKELENAVFTAVGNSTSHYSFSEYQACVQLRTFSASSCVKEIADDLTQKVGARTESDVVDAKAISALEPEAAAAMKRAVDECGERPDAAEAYLKVNLSGCL